MTYLFEVISSLGNPLSKIFGSTKRPSFAGCGGRQVVSMLALYFDNPFFMLNLCLKRTKINAKRGQGRPI